MKTVILTLALVLASPVTHSASIDTDAMIDTSVGSDGAIALATLIRINGYSCSSISAVVRESSDDFTVVCNNWRYSFQVNNRGGKWSVVAV